MRSRDGTGGVASGRGYSFGSVLLGLGLIVGCRGDGFDDCNSVAECVGAPVDGGAGQRGGESGLGGDPLGAEEPTLLPVCELYEGVGVQALAVLTVARTSTGSGAQLYSWDKPSSTVLYRVWDGVPTGWSPWACFELLPRVTQLAAMNLANTQPEVFALSGTGVLFVRRDSTQGWSPWLPFGLPDRASMLSDVAAVGGKLARVYVVDRGRVFVRTKVAQTAYAGYGAWQGLQENSALHLAALQRRDGQAQIVTVDRAGVVQTAFLADGASRFDEWMALTRLPQEVVELEAVDVGQLVIYALDAEGAVWGLVADTPQASWVALPSSETLGKVVGIAALADGDTPQLFRSDADGNTDILRGL